jgi:NADH-quinone oxidoreductase subunit J
VKALEIALFALSALLCVGGGLGTVLARRPVHSALGLLTAILGVTGCYLMLSAEFLAAVQIIVYAGAVVVLFLFVAMLLGPAADPPRDGQAALPRWVAALTFAAASAGALGMVLRLATSFGPELEPRPAGFGTISAIGRDLFTAKIVPFELTGLLLLVAVVAAMAVARGKHQDPTRPVRGNAPPARTDAVGPEEAS